MWVAPEEGWEHAVAFGFDSGSGGKCLEGFEQQRRLMHPQSCALGSSFCRALSQNAGQMKLVRRLMQQSSPKVMRCTTAAEC